MTTPDTSQSKNNCSPREYVTRNLPGEDILHLLGKTPPRWGRMPALCRAVVVETGRVLHESGYTKQGYNLKDTGLNVGLIGGTKRGSLATDLAFTKTLARGPAMASPALFSYTLANAPLAEASVHFGLTSPVYALFSSPDPLALAVTEARRWLAQSDTLSFMLACSFDHHTNDSLDSLAVTMTLIERNQKS